MDAMIEDYMLSTFHPDLVDTLSHAFQRMDDFGLPDYEFDFINLLMISDNDSPQSTQDHFITFIHAKIDTIIHAHMMRLSDTATLFQKIEIVDALFNIQHLSDYSSIIIVLESAAESDEKIAEVLSQCCKLPSIAILSIFEMLDETVLTALKDYIYNKEKNEGKHLTSFTELQKKIVKNLKAFKQFRENKNCLGTMLLDANMLIGQPLEKYIPYIDEVLKNTNVEQLSVDIFSLILLTDEGFNNPILTFHKHSGLLLEGLDIIGKVDVQLMRLSGAFEKFKSNLTVTEGGA